MPSSESLRVNETMRLNPVRVASARAFVVVTILILIGTAAWFWIAAPDPVPSHFDATGQADDWSSKAGTLGILLPLGLGISAIFSIRWIWEKVPAAFLNIPHRDYWLEQGNRPYLFDCLMQFMRITAGCLTLLFSWCLVQILLTGLGVEIPGLAMWAAMIVFLIGVGLGTWNLIRRLTLQK